MSRLTSAPVVPAQLPPQGPWHPAPPSSGGLAAGLITGLIVLGVGAGLLWYYLGPDLRRYMKIRNM
jgi:hypothetical protein